MTEQPPSPGPVLPPGVQAARTRLAQLPELPLAEHVAAYEGVHRLLQEALGTLDER